MHGIFVVVISKKEKTTMKLAIGIDVHKDKCTACAAYAGIGEPRERHLDFMRSSTNVSKDSIPMEEG